MAKYGRPADYLKFLSGLYALAADFDERKLRAIRRQASIEEDESVVSAASMLLHLIGNQRPHTASYTPKVAANSGREGVRAILLSKKIFPSNAALVSLASATLKVSHKQKESRSRLVERILRATKIASVRDRERFREALETCVAERNGKSNSDFVTRWTKVIKDL